MLTPSTEVECLADFIFAEEQLHAFHPIDWRVLLCGDWRDIMSLLEYMSSLRPPETFMNRIIVATEELDPFIDKYFGKEDLRIVDWDDSGYEEELIERVKSPKQSYAITLAVDFKTNPRRLKRIRAILEESGTLVIPHELPEWRDRYPGLMQSFTMGGGQLVKLAETIKTANRIRQLQLQLQEKRPTRRLHSFTDDMEDRER